MIFSSSAMRSSRDVTEKVANARRAAATALSTSALEPSEMRAKASSLAGLMTSIVLGVTGSTHLPSI